ncbi:hypothetical protein R2601_03933 [Salipiger bermudensis HTCC2601]|uniref:Uncharacterized protein n=1 Tax=Salipiger bermudensis (strain DSM 26914 / JCM 13377 / KCTC 12554 / HTCC2601) TaxID=314265 RepID=Q0FW59_SALBH|nr:hypothetical protein R2601_03933 [Salipiger bermudensis HTCC2601]
MVSSSSLPGSSMPSIRPAHLSR